MTRSHRAPRAPSALRAPIKDVIDDALSEADVQRMWRDLQSGRPRPPRLHLAAIGAACALALAGALASRLLPSEASGPAGPLALVGADASRSGLGAAQAFGGAQPQRLSLDDGSRIALARAARLEVLRNTGHAFATRLHTGRGEFDVKPGGPRRWSIECGTVTVEVVGTHFAIERSAGGVRVDVSRGVVLVRGEGVADGARRLTAGQSLYVQAERASAEPARAAVVDARPAQSLAPATTQSPPATAIPTPTITPAVVAPTAVPAGDSARPSPHEPVFSAATAELWLAHADDARRRGQRARAAALLERVVERAPDSPHAALAALSLARLLMSEDPARAGAALASVRRAAAPAGLREDLMARLVEARAREGRLDLALEAADDYTRAFPHGRRLDEVRQWTSMRRP